MAGRIFASLQICAAIFTTYFWFFPILNFYFDDEWFFLSERIWFYDRLDWLAHLLFFSQTRFVWVGDYILYRPGLFLWAWVQDVLFRTDRIGQQILLVGVAVFVLSNLYFMIRREVGKGVALGACLLALTCPIGLFAYQWPHLSGYFLAIGLYTLAGILYSSEFLSVRKALLTAAVFFLAESFHEFVAITLVLIVLAELWHWRRESLSQLRVRLLATLLPLLAYGLMVIVAYLSLKPPTALSPAEGSVEFSATHLLNMLRVLKSLLMQIAYDLIPLPALFPMVEVVRIGLGTLAVLGAVWILVLSRAEANRRKLLIAALPIFAILLGLTVGRIATRLNVKDHYAPIFQYFVVMTLMLAYSVKMRGRVKLKAIIAGLLTLGSVHAANVLRLRSANRPALLSATETAVRGAHEFLEANPGRCFSGLFDPSNRASLNSALNIALQEYVCGWRPGRAAFLMASADGKVTEFQPQAPPEMSKVKSLLEGLAPQSRTDELKSYLSAQPFNFREAESGDFHTGEVAIAPDYGKIVAHAVIATFESDDPFPRLNNVGIKLWNDKQGLYFLLLNNDLKVIKRTWADDSSQELVSTQISSMSQNLNLRVTIDGGHCLVFLNDYLLNQVGDCLAGPIQAALLGLENATETERLTGLYYLP